MYKDKELYASSSSSMNFVHGKVKKKDESWRRGENVEQRTMNEIICKRSEK